MKIKDIYEFEKNRDFSIDKYKIRLFKDGNWWRMYEWSAFLSHNFPNGLETNKRLRVCKRHYVDLDVDLVIVGLQLSSFDKYFPNVKIKDGLLSVNDGYVDVDVGDFYKKNCIDFNSGFSVLEDWKRSVKYIGKREEKRITESFDVFYKDSNSKNGINNIITEIINYQICNNNLIESITFLNKIQVELKRLVNAK